MLQSKTTLVLAPHTDDGEFGCGGTIAKLAEAGTRVIYVAFSAAEQSVPAHLPRDVLRKEVKEATRRLDIAPDDCLVLKHEVRRFPEFRQAILDDMICLNRDYRPDLVFLPSLNDTHQDHYVIAQEGFRAFKRTSMLGYEVPWNNLDFKTTCFSILKESHIAKKMAAVACYDSQRGRAYSNPEFLRSLAVMRGVQIGAEYAEAFEVVRWVTN
ncbi:PIG-L deacetylase family protein [Frateuria sp. Soil773]|uniref:PIG-L deacetylase family protein n=1 Tax=Frateuria sp. Soil773 TaxID=1736407 RepID=UPI0009E97000|nr:PIG-L deacetylase family protein [Frateuria sp. Soil773]